MGRTHDPACLRLNPEISDAEVALAMQMEEVANQEMHRQSREVQHRLFLQQQRLEDASNQLWDPLWGEFPVPVAAMQRYRVHALFGCCPCCLVGCDAVGRKHWSKFLLSWSTLLGVLQVFALVVAILVHGGLAPFELNPMIGPPYYVFDALGAKNTSKILVRNEWWRLFSPMMLHAGWLHLLGNLMVQLRTGAMLEVVWGHSAWLFIYIVSGAFGVLCGCATTPLHLGVGSSGALCGLIGAWLMFILITWNQTTPVDIRLRNAQTFSVGMSIVTIVCLSFLPLMDFAAHVGGLSMGAALAMVLFGSRLQSNKWRISCQVSGALLTVAFLAGGFVWLLMFTTADPVMLELGE